MIQKAVIFLDMDGVLATPRALVAQPELPHPDKWIDPVAVRYLNLLCQAGRALVVVSSTWRERRSRREFSALLARVGFDGRLHRDWRTRQLNGIRGDEVRDWMQRHPEVTRHLILDDDEDFHEGQPVVLTDSIDGMGYRHFRAALALLCPGEGRPQTLSQRQAGRVEPAAARCLSTRPNRASRAKPRLENAKSLP